MTLGQALDAYIEDDFTVESLYLYHDQEAQPHAIVTTSRDSFEYTEVLTKHHDLKQEVADLKKQVEALQTKLRVLKRDKKSIESAIAKLVKYQA